MWRVRPRRWETDADGMRAALATMRCVQKAVRWSQKLADALAGGEPGAVVAVATDDELACEDVRSGEDVEKLSVLELWRLQFIADLPADVRAAMVRALAAVSPKVTTYPISDGHSWPTHRRRAVRRFGRRRLVTGRSSPCRTCAGSPPPPRGGAGSTCAVTPTPLPDDYGASRRRLSHRPQQNPGTGDETLRLAWGKPNGSCLRSATSDSTFVPVVIDISAPQWRKQYNPTASRSGMRSQSPQRHERHSQPLRSAAQSTHID